jgi:hypothetical protein
MGGRRHYPSIGGIAAWRIPVLAGVAAMIAAGGGEWAVALTIVGVSVVLGAPRLGRVVDVGPAGLTQGLALGVDGVRPPKFLGVPRVLPWGAIEEIGTTWARAGDYTALVTVVRSPGAGTIVFGSAMGLAAYRTLIADIVRRAPQARRTGLTDEVLVDADGRSPWRWSTERVAVGAAVVLLALWGLARLL